jgi:DNA polymerase I-like protein with 3'-5' exonuclease and polymerase domains
VPARIVGPYAIGDIIRTRRLYDYIKPKIDALGMGEAYDRERQLLPILMENEREGMRVDVGALEEDVATYRVAFNLAEDALRNRLRASGLNFDSDQDVADVLIKRGIVDVGNFQLTAGGAYSMSKENLLPEVFNDRQVASVLGYRNRLQTCLSMFMEPWLGQAMMNNGRITTNWNQIRGHEAGGTRTGRPSTNEHNFLNISKSFDGRDDQYTHPTVIDVPALPLCRQYVLPDEGEMFLHRDFSGQELRVFAHFEKGELHEEYHKNPLLDPHKFIGESLMEVARREIERTRVKTLNFQSIYGGGVPALQKKLRCSTTEAKQLKQQHDLALPGRKILNEEITRVVRRGDPIRTWGGRLYFPEPPGADGRDKIYKLINYIVQGSAADLTKQALIDWHGHPDRAARFLVTVYDEINISAPPGPEALFQMELLKMVMERDRITVPMKSDGKRGRSWGTLEKCA